MAISNIKKNMRLPVLGKIRLGVRKKSSNNKDYPSETEHFVLTDCPEVAKVYGETPTELDIYFPGNDPDKVIPNWLKWYSGGVRGKDGSIVGGRLQCYGDGPTVDDQGNEVPGTAHFLAQRDPVTREVPTRECWGAKCPDWKDENGYQKCKPSMQVFFILPRVSILGVYQIDTTSWNAIRSFVSQVELIKESYGKLANIPFKIFREETATSFVDKNGKEQTRTHYIMKIKPNEDFVEKFGHEVDEKLKILQPRWSPNEDALIEAPMEDNFPVDNQSYSGQLNEGSSVPASSDPGSAINEVEKIAEDEDLAPLFTELCNLRGVSNTKKTRLLTARKFESSSDIRTELRAYLEEKIEEAKPKDKKSGKKGGKQQDPSPDEAEGLI